MTAKLITLARVERTPSPGWDGNLTQMCPLIPCLKTMKACTTISLEQELPQLTPLRLLFLHACRFRMLVCSMWDQVRKKVLSLCHRSLPIRSTATQSNVRFSTLAGKCQRFHGLQQTSQVKMVTQSSPWQRGPVP